MVSFLELPSDTLQTFPDGVRKMSWYGFGFNGFGQIVAHGSADTGEPCVNQVKVVVPTAVELPDKCGDSSVTKDCSIQLSASWSRTALFPVQANGEVHLTGFLDGVPSSRRSITTSNGCLESYISERYLTLRFSDKVECWSCDGADMELVWKTEQDSSEKETGDSPQLPLVPGGYIAHIPPLFRPLSAQLQAQSLALGSGHAVLLCASGAIYTWGNGSHGQLGHGGLVLEEEPRVVEALWGVPLRSVAAGGWHSACIGEGGDLYMWGWNESGQLGLPSRRCRKKAEENKEVGPAGDEQSGDTSEDVCISIQSLPALVDIQRVSEVKTISCGARHTAAVSSDGNLYTWGWGDYGQLGHGPLCSSDEPCLVDFFPTNGLHVEDVRCGQWNTFASVRIANPTV
ncbi:RCC1 domain-containing protein 1-like [Engraulis encrasicolus]|uniref:RCC1 domain-containing protein 1-like n=1 Tax=Engraulis encrasicolus TaxID=184585 RepID=UPI002FD06187